MKQMLMSLSVRERLMLCAGILILTVSGFYAFVFRPLLDEQKRLMEGISNQQQIHGYLLTISKQVSELRQRANDTNVVVGSESPMSIIDGSSVQMGVKPSIKRLVPENQERVGVWLEKCAFDSLIAWLAELDERHAIKVKQIDISRDAGINGLVSGKVILGNQ